MDFRSHQFSDVGISTKPRRATDAGERHTDPQDNGDADTILEDMKIDVFELDPLGYSNPNPRHAERQRSPRSQSPSLIPGFVEAPSFDYSEGHVYDSNDDAHDDADTVVDAAPDRHLSYFDSLSDPFDSLPDPFNSLSDLSRVYESKRHEAPNKPMKGYSTLSRPLYRPGFSPALGQDKEDEDINPEPSSDRYDYYRDKVFDSPSYRFEIGNTAVNKASNIPGETVDLAPNLHYEQENIKSNSSHYTRDKARPAYVEEVNGGDGGGNPTIRGTRVSARSSKREKKQRNEKRVSNEKKRSHSSDWYSAVRIIPNQGPLGGWTTLSSAESVTDEPVKLTADVRPFYDEISNYGDGPYQDAAYEPIHVSSNPPGPALNPRRKGVFGAPEFIGPLAIDDDDYTTTEIRPSSFAGVSSPSSNYDVFDIWRESDKLTADLIRKLQLEAGYHISSWNYEDGGAMDRLVDKPSLSAPYELPYGPSGPSHFALNLGYRNLSNMAHDHDQDDADIDFEGSKYYPTSNHGSIFDSGSYGDKLSDAFSYRGDVTDKPIPLTADLLDKQQHAEASFDVSPRRMPGPRPHGLRRTLPPDPSLDAPPLQNYEDKIGAASAYEAIHNPSIPLDPALSLRRQAHPRAPEPDNTDAQPSEQIILHGGLAKNGRPAELVRMKDDGTAISLATGKQIKIESFDGGEKNGAIVKRSLEEEFDDDESIIRSLIRRKRSATDEIQAKKCREPSCTKEFKRPCDLTKHEKTHSRPWKCQESLCKYHEYGWPTEKELDRHVNDKHSPTPRLFKCEFLPCPYQSKRESNCKQHMEKAHKWVYVRSKNKSNGYHQVPTQKQNALPIRLITTADIPHKQQPVEATLGLPTNSWYSQSLFCWLAGNESPYDHRIGQCVKHEGSPYSSLLNTKQRENVLQRIGNPYSSPLNTKQRENRRKVIRIRIKDKDHLACPDSGSAKNIMSKAFAFEHRFRIRQKVKDKRPFELGNGDIVWSIGRVLQTVALPGSPLWQKKRWFYVLENCPVRVVMGRKFLREAEILTKYRHLLENCPEEMSDISALLWIGSPRNKLPTVRCTVDGRQLEAAADTGSDLNLMSLQCAEREGFRIDRREGARTYIEVGNGNVVKTIGQVYVSNLTLDWREPEAELPEQSPRRPANDVPPEPDSHGGTRPPRSEDDSYIPFHVVENLQRDIIFGQKFLHDTDAFNKYPDLLDAPLTQQSRQFEKHKQPYEFKIYRERIFPWLRFSNKPKPAVDKREQHESDWYAELYRRSENTKEVALLPPDKQEVPQRAEIKKVRDWNAAHARCQYCEPRSRPPA